LSAAEIFTVLHPKKANDVRGKWSEIPAYILSRLLNYSKDGVHYGVYFMEPVNPEKDNCPDYRKVVTHPIDLGTINNRIYLDYYKSLADIWKDIGYVFKNCRLYNSHEDSDIRILGDTLRELAIVLYREYFKNQNEKYFSMVKELETSLREFVKDHEQERLVVEQQVALELESFRFRLFDAFEKALEAMSRSEREPLKVAKANYLQILTVNTAFFREDSCYLTALIKELEKVFCLSLGIEGGRIELDRIKQSILDTIEYSRQVIVAERFEQLTVKELNLHSKEEIEMFNPGEFTFAWVRDADAQEDVENEELIYIDPKEEAGDGLGKEVDKVYLVKWTNLSYLDLTWEKESVIDSPLHVNEFRSVCHFTQSV
jgi:hypothetical protein